MLGVRAGRGAWQEKTKVLTGPGEEAPDPAGQGRDMLDLPD